MVNYLVYTRDTRIRDVDYLLEDGDKFLKLLPYMRKKISGDWSVAILEPDIKFVRKIADMEDMPEYINLSLYMEKAVSEQIMSEKPRLLVKEKTAYEKYQDMIGEMKVLIDPKAAQALYRRVSTSKDKLPEYLQRLSSICENKITVADVVREVPDERRLYASDVINSFLLKTRWRWSQYNKLVSELGRDYAYFAMRKYVSRLLLDKNKFLNNEDTEIRLIDKLDSLSINLAFVLFNTTKPEELDTCMYLLDNKDKARRLLQ